MYEEHHAEITPIFLANTQYIPSYLYNSLIDKGHRNAYDPVTYRKSRYFLPFFFLSFWLGPYGKHDKQLQFLE